MEQKALMVRLLKYKRVLLQLQSVGLEKVFSNNLSDALDISSALVRKDFSHFDIVGNRRGGYNIESVMKRINQLVGDHQLQEAIVIGCGNLGKALISHDFTKEGIKIAAGFDINPTVPEINGIPIYPMEVVKHFVMEHHIEVGIISVPISVATQTRDMMAQAGIRGILNFSPIELKSCDSCIINNVNIGLEMENLFFLIKQAELRKNKSQ